MLDAQQALDTYKRQIQDYAIWETELECRMNHVFGVGKWSGFSSRGDEDEDLTRRARIDGMKEILSLSNEENVRIVQQCKQEVAGQIEAIQSKAIGQQGHADWRRETDPYRACHC